MSPATTPLLPDTWVGASWDDYLQTVSQPALAKAKGYYHKGLMRVEMLPVGHDHAADNAMVDFAVRLFCMVRGIAVKGLVNCSYRKVSLQECQPDLSYYLRQQAQAIPWGTAVVDLRRFAAPDLAIEIAVSSIVEDQSIKRSLYEELKIREYWVVDVQAVEVVAYGISDRGSSTLSTSEVLPGLDLAIVTEALRRSRQQDQTEVGTWLLSQFQAAG